MRVYNQGDGVEFKAWFEATPGVPTVPQTAHWRLRCLSSNKVLVDWTEVQPVQVADESGIVGVYVQIDVDGALNVMQDTTVRRETKQLQVSAAKGTARQYSKFLEYAVANADL